MLVPGLLGKFKASDANVLLCKNWGIPVSFLRGCFVFCNAAVLWWVGDSAVQSNVIRGPMSS